MIKTDSATPSQAFRLEISIEYFSARAKKAAISSERMGGDRRYYGKLVIDIK
jgi:hypothetical protein